MLNALRALLLAFLLLALGNVLLALINGPPGFVAEIFRGYGQSAPARPPWPMVIAQTVAGTEFAVIAGFAFLPGLAWIGLLAPATAYANFTPAPWLGTDLFLASLTWAELTGIWLIGTAPV